MAWDYSTEPEFQEQQDADHPGALESAAGDRPADGVAALEHEVGNL